MANQYVLMRMWFAVIVMLFASLPLLTACVTTPTAERIKQEEGHSTDPRPTQLARADPAAKDVTYTIINTTSIPRIKQSLDVLLNRKVHKNVLRAIALELKSGNPRKYQRTFILYYLPGMKLGAGAWATTHFNPDLEVRIYGLTVAEEADLRAVAQEADLRADILGIWLDERPFVANKTTIYRQNGKLYMEWKFHDGNSINEEMVKKTSLSGERFEEKGSSHILLAFGEYYVVNQRGNLELRDNDGLISTAKAIQ